MYATHWLRKCKVTVMHDNLFQKSYQYALILKKHWTLMCNEGALTTPFQSAWYTSPYEPACARSRY